MSAVIASTSRSIALDTLLDWFRHHGGRLAGTALQWSGTGWGLVATRTLAAGETVLHVPRQIVLSTDIVRASEIGERLQGGGIDAERTIFAAWLARKRHQTGHWRPLVDTFEQDLSYLPGLTRRADREWLQGSHVERVAREGWQALCEQFRRVNDLLPRAERLPLRDFAWGWHLYVTQSFLVSNGGGTQSGLVPLAGTLPHSKACNCRFDSDDKGFRVFTTGPVAAGTPLTTNYGALSSLQLFGKYGRFPEDELDFRAVLALDVGREHWLHSVAPHLTGGEAAPCFTLALDTGANEAQRLFSMLRLLGACSRAEAREMLRLAAGSTSIPFVDAHNEQGALQRLKAACEQALAAFTTSEQEDTALLQPGKLGGWQRQCVLLRRSEKCILQHHLGLAQKGLHLLDHPAVAQIHSPEAEGPAASYFRQLRSGLAASDSRAANDPLPTTPGAGPATANVIGFPAAQAALSSGERRLCNWFFEQGGIVRGAAVRLHNGLRGMVATRDIEPGEIVMRVPRHLYMTERTAMQSPIGLALVQHLGTDMDKMCYLAAYIVELRRSGGRWSPMVDALPQAFNERPECFSRSAWALLEGTEAAVRAEHYWRRVRHDYRRVRAALPPAMRMSFRSFLWAHQTVCTRSFTLRMDGTALTGLIPVAEMFNHAIAPSCAWGGDSTRHFDVTARQRISAGMPLTISYGSSYNTRLLAQYGFCLEDNNFDAVKLRFRIDRSHWVHDFAPELIHRETTPAFDVGRHPHVDEMKRLFSFLRLLAMPDAEAARAHPATRSARSAHVPVVDAANEAAALRRLVEECGRRLEGYPSSAEEDDMLLASGTLTATERSAVVYRRAQKRLVEDVRAHARRALDALALEPAQRNAALVQAERESVTWHPYFTQLRRALE